MPCCVAVNCTNQQFKDCGKTFHKIPFSKPELAKKWIVNIRRDKWNPIKEKRSYVCSDHFQEKFFDRTGQTVRLRANAVPTVFDFSTPSLEIKCRRRKKAIPLPNPEPVDSDSFKPLCHEHSTYTAVKNMSTISTKLHGSLDLGYEDNPILGKHLAFHDRSTCTTLDNLIPCLSTVIMDHHYSSSPAEIAQRLEDNKTLRKKLKTTEQIVRRLKKRMESIQEVVSVLEVEEMLSEAGANMLRKVLTGKPLALITRIQRSSKQDDDESEEFILP